MYTKETAEEIAYFFREDKFKDKDQEVTTVKMDDGWHIFLDEEDVTFQVNSWVLKERTLRKISHDKLYFVAGEEIQLDRYKTVKFADMDRSGKARFTYNSSKKCEVCYKDAIVIDVHRYYCAKCYLNKVRG